MSNKVRNLAVSKHLGLGGSAKTVFLHLCDIAKDDGTDIWRAKTTIADELELGRATVFRAIGALEEAGLILEVGQVPCANGHTINYRIDLKKLEGLQPTKASQRKDIASQASQGESRLRARRHPSQSETRTIQEPPISSLQGENNYQVERHAREGAGGFDLLDVADDDRAQAAGADPRGLGPRDGDIPSPGWLAEGHRQGNGPAVEDPLGDGMTWAGEDLPERETEAIAPWPDDDAAASEAQALGATRASGPSPPADDPLPEAVDEDPAPDLPKRPEAEVRALPLEEVRPWSKEDWQVFYDERAGIAEFDGRLSRVEAEALAYEGCLVEWRERNPVGSPTTARELAAASLAAMGLTDPADHVKREQQGDRVSPGWISRHQRARGSSGGERALPSRASSRVRPPVWQGSYGEAEGWAEGRRS